jgi:PilZ domain
MALSMQHNDRRATGVRRVPVERIVDVCAIKSAAGSAFQGWSMNVSGRGMSVRATHLPELNAPVIVRFQEHGSEVIAEAEVAWRNETPSGAEFGVRFTALDSRSVQALKTLCQAEPLPVLSESPAEPPTEDDLDTEPAPPTTPSVKLHIDGLASPMQARVRQHGQQKVALGSQLDFLRVGRNVEVEEGQLGDRRRARIDEVDVAVDPESQVPELIVSLRYDTPVPRTVSRGRGSIPRPAKRNDPVEASMSRKLEQVFAVEDVKATAPTAPTLDTGKRTSLEREARPEKNDRSPLAPLAAPAAGAERDESSEGEAPADHDAFAALDDLERELASEANVRARTGARERTPARYRPRPSAATLRSNDGDANERDANERDANERDADVDLELTDEVRDGPSLEIEESDGRSDAERLRQRLDGVLDNLSSAARVASARCRRLGEAASRGASWVAVQARTGRSALAAQRAALPRRRTAAAPRGSLRASAARLTRLQSPRIGADAASSGRIPRRAAFAGAVIGAVALATWLGRGSSGAEVIAPLAPRATQTAPAANAAPGSEPTDESTPGQHPRPLVPPDDSEPADVEPTGVVAQLRPSGPSSRGPGPVKGAETPARASLEKRALARYAVNEHAFEAPPAPSARQKTGAPAEFGSGRMDLPIVYRLRLDQPGAGLRGERTPTGFDVIIPGRKTMEEGTAITKRDPRIAKVTTKNGSDGARVSFHFRSAIPAYKVRLRNDYVEFFINSK